MGLHFSPLGLRFSLLGLRFSRVRTQCEPASHAKEKAVMPEKNKQNLTFVNECLTLKST